MKSFSLVCAALLVAGCNGGAPPPVDATTDGPCACDAAADTEAAVTTIAQLPSGPPQAIAGLDGAVDVVIDTHGWPHIYATTLHDAMFVEGLLVARDRMPQLELIRRVGNGTLAQAFGVLSPGLVERDIAARVVGLRRVATAMWTQMQDGRGKTALQAYTAGINRYLRDVRDGTAHPPTGTDLVVNDTTPDWTEIDSLVVARYQSFALTYDDGDIAFSAARTASQTTFDNADAVMHPDLAARHGLFWDVVRFAPPSTTEVLPNFYTAMHDRFQRNDVAPALPAQTLRNVQTFRDRIREMRSVIAERERGSNNWVVSAAASANGHAMLANDPHLSLTAPAVWWGVHVTITQGPDAVDVAGVSFPGIPGIVLGYNTHVAWGATVANYDVTDVFAETIVPGTGGQPDSAMINGQPVPITVIHEMIDDGMGRMIDAPIEFVAPHGPILPTIANRQIVPRTGTSAMTIRWTGFQPTRDLDAFVGLWYASTVAEARTALNAFDVGAENWVIADTQGNIGYTTHAVVPIRAPGARTWDPMSNPNGTLPCAVLPGTGAAEWTGNVDPAQLPNAVNSATLTTINTSNNDQAGLVVADNNPVNDPVYLGCWWADGWRAERVAQRLAALNGHVSIGDMQSIQNDHALLIGGRFRPFLAAAMTVLQDEWAHPGTHADLAAFAASAMPRRAALQDAAARIMAWSLDSPSGMEYDASDADRANAVATSLFHAWLGHVLSDTLDDEAMATGSTYDEPIRGVLFLLEHPDPAVMRSYNAATHQSAAWDDLRTATVTETRDLILVRALDRGMADLAAHAASADVSTWLWGHYHFVRFDSIVPGPGAGLSIPPPMDMTYPNGFPRAGGIESVDVAAAGFTFPYLHSTGPSQRFTVEMDPAGPHGFNALPGGESFDRTSPHQHDESDLWRTNTVHPVPRTVREVIAAFESRLRFAPM